MLSSKCFRMLFARNLSVREFSSNLVRYQHVPGRAPTNAPPTPSGLNVESKLAQTVIKRMIPMFDRVLVLKAEAINKTEGGIVLPEKSQKKVLTGTVVAVGPGSRNQKGEIVPLQVSVGDNVLLPEYGGTKVEMEANKEYYLFRESDILAKVEM